MIKLLIVDDSIVITKLLIRILTLEPVISLVGVAKNGREAIEMAEKLKPDVITMDINMPEMNGLEATRKIMETNPVPIIIVSGYSKLQEMDITFQAMEAGAVSVLEKPVLNHPDYDNMVKKYIKTVRLMSKVKVVRRWPADRYPSVPGKTLQKEKIQEKNSKVEIIAIGASTGGPVVIQTILSGLLQKISVPVLIVQHIASGFIQGMTEWLSRGTGLPIHIAGHNEALLPGHVYFAPDDRHMEAGRNRNVLLRKGERKNGVCPSISCLFQSVAEVYGSSAVGILLTGMGRDGADELKLMKDKGAATIAQDKESSVVYGMPGEAIKQGGAMYILPPDRIVEKLVMLLEKKVEKDILINVKKNNYCVNHKERLAEYTCLMCKKELCKLCFGSKVSGASYCGNCRNIIEDVRKRRHGLSDKKETPYATKSLDIEPDRFELLLKEARLKRK